MQLTRINKFIAESGFCSRRQADRLIQAGSVKINQQLATLGDKVQPNDKVYIDDKEIIVQKDKKVYLAFYKPVGVITTTDASSPNNIIDYIKFPERIFPVGRLDVNTSGLIILTNDGEIVNKILRGKNKIEKEYLVNVDKTITREFLHGLKKGIMLDGYRTLPTKTEEVSDKSFTITILEGKNRQVRRMCEFFGYNVFKLKRIRIGKIELGDLPLGQYKQISREDLL